MFPVEPNDSSESGFTLIEVIVSFLILATVLGSTTLSISYSASLYRKADQIRVADQLAENVIAERFDTRPQQPENEMGATVIKVVDFEEGTVGRFYREWGAVDGV